MVYGEPVQIPEIVDFTDDVKALLYDLPVVCLCIDQDYELLYSNKKAAEFFQFDGTEDEFSVFQFASPMVQPDGALSMEKADIKIAEAMENGRAHFQWMHLSMQGEELPAEVDLRRVTCNGILCLFAYIEPVAAHPESLNASVEYLQMILDGMPLSITLWNDDYTIKDCNAETLKLFGLTKKREYKEHFMELSPAYQQHTGEPSEAQFYAYAEEAKKKGRLTFDWMHQKQDGELLPVEMTIVWQKVNNRMCMTSYVQDLRLINSYLEQIGEADERTQIMLDVTPLACTFWDENLNILDCNKEAVKLFGLSSKKEFCENYHLLSPEYQPDGRISSEVTMEKLVEAFETGVAEFEWMHCKLNGELIPTEVKMVRVKRKGVYNLTAYIRDVRELKAMLKDLVDAKEAAEEANIAKSSFLSNMSHEIRTPMNAITGMADLLAHENLSERERKYVNDIKTSSTALLGIINEILDFSKIEAGKFQLLPVSFDLYELLNNVESMFKLVARQKGIEFILEMRETLPRYLFGDDIRIRQILVNNIGNAIKFTGEGHVKLSVYKDSGMLYFDVSDTGIGIKKKELGRIFESFTQVDSGKNRRSGGTGLGLSITKTLVGMMEGTISVESEYGKGTIFHIGIPYVQGKEEDIRKETQSARLISAPDAKVLVVDDNEINLNVASGLLRLFDIACDTAPGGREAIEMIGKRAYDIVFMDHMMPVMDGVEATRYLREHGYVNGKLVIVALTANAVDGVKEMLIEGGMDDFLAKPIDKALLNQILCKWLPMEKIRYDVKAEEKPEGATASGITGLVKVNVPEMDVDLALSRIGGMVDVFEQSLRIMARRLPEVCGRLEGFLAAGDAKGFAIEVHGSKGSLNNVGAVKLAKQAEAMEDKAKGGDLAFCKEKLPPFIAELKTLHGRLAAIIGAERSRPEKKTGDMVEFTEKLDAVRGYLDRFESDEAVELLKELSEYDYGEEKNALLGDVLQLTEEFDYEKAIERIDMTA